MQRLIVVGIQATCRADILVEIAFSLDSSQRLTLRSQLFRHTLKHISCVSQFGVAWIARLETLPKLTNGL